MRDKKLCSLTKRLLIVKWTIKTRQDKTIQDKIRQGKTRQDKVNKEDLFYANGDLELKVKSLKDATFFLFLKCIKVEDGR